MNIGSEMVEAASQSRSVLGDSVSLVKDFFRQRVCSDGGFAGRTGGSDLYYTVFGLSGLLALEGRLEPGAFRHYLDEMQPETLPDLVHLAAYIRCRSLLNLSFDKLKMYEYLLNFCSPQGGFVNFADSDETSIYSCFLALGAFQDIGASLPDEQVFVQYVQSLQLDNGGFANSRDSKTASTPATAAALVISRCLGIPVKDKTTAWLLDQHDGSGFIAVRGTCGPDLLSTAVAIHSLVRNGIDIDPLREPLLDFIDSLWSGKGGFFGNWFDTVLDCEYAFYGLLALGHLA